ncbi:MAG TPA: hypothetical protein VI363_03525 [Burkholderiales bacterium]
MADVENPPKPESAGNTRPPRSTLKSALLVVAVILLLVAMSFLGLGLGYFNALYNKH